MVVAGFHHVISHFYFITQISSHCQTLQEKLPVINSFCVGYPEAVFDSSAITFIFQVPVIIIEEKNNKQSKNFLII